MRNDDVIEVKYITLHGLLRSLKCVSSLWEVTIHRCKQALRTHLTMRREAVSSSCGSLIIYFLTWAWCSKRQRSWAPQSSLCDWGRRLSWAREQLIGLWSMATGSWKSVESHPRLRYLGASGSEQIGSQLPHRDASSTVLTWEGNYVEPLI